MQLNITHMITRDLDDMPLLSGSTFELGPTAARITWNNSRDYAAKNPLLKTPEQFQEARDYLESFGAWDEEERAHWTDQTIQALIVQFIAGSIRKMEHFDSFEDFEKAAREGKVSADIYCGDDRQFYAYIGS